MEHGIESGDTCYRDGCLGEIEELDTEGGCYCSTARMAPCGYCTTPREYCETCGWDAKDEMDANYGTKEKGSAMNSVFKNDEIVYLKSDLQRTTVTHDAKRSIEEIRFQADDRIFYMVNGLPRRDIDLVSQDAAMKYRVGFLAGLITETSGIKF